jgi:hypothetical protein
VVVVHSYMAMATADVLGGTKRRKPNERTVAYVATLHVERNR